MTDPVDLTAALVRCPSVTPAEGGAIELVARMLAAAGFRVARADRSGIANLFGGFFGPMMVGWLKSRTGDFSLAFSVLADEIEHGERDATTLMSVTFVPQQAA